MRNMAYTTVRVPQHLMRFELPQAVHQRLQGLLDRQDQGYVLTTDERQEAEGLVELAEFLPLLRLHVTRTALA